MDRESRCDRLCSWFRGPLFLLYVNYFSVTWGNRMWNFALGLFFVNIANQELRLTAIYGFTMGGSVLLFGGMVGNWVDRTNRLTAVRTSIIIQKISVALCATIICVLLIFQAELKALLEGWLYLLCKSLVVILAVLAELATMSYLRIELEKDWFIVVTEGKKSKLANLNATTRVVDLITNIVSPILIGQIMTSKSQVIAGAAIAGWHLCAIVIEFLLLSRIYKKIPEMAVKKTGNSEESKHLNGTDEKEMMPKTRSESMNGLSSKEKQMESVDTDNDEEDKNGCCQVACSPCIILWTGWKTYARQMVVFAGLALSMLYMTVLGFDTITVGYIYGNGIQENLVGVVMAVGSLAGVLGAFLYTQFRKCLGLERTGLISLSWQICCLVLCVFSVWLSGSPFKPETLWKGHQEVNVTDTSDVWCSNSSLAFTYTDNSNSPGDYATVLNSSDDSLHPTVRQNTTNCTDKEDVGVSLISESIIVFMVGITCSRIGLYLTDLVISQIQQENVPERERGMVNGVQNSLNNLMDMCKFILVIFIPRIETFGYLIILSFVFICFSGLFYAYHCFKMSQYSVGRCLAGKSKMANAKVIQVEV